jgi:hypothetical protein
MIVIIGLLVLLAAVVVGVIAVTTNTGSAHGVGDQFAVLGHPLAGVSTGQLFLYGIVVGVVGMLGLSMLLGTFNRRLASRGSRRELKGSRRESAALRLDRERLTQQLDDERSEHQRNGAQDPAASSNATPDLTAPHPAASDLAAPDPAPAEPAGLWHRISHPAGR